jgi:hypothetical protein
MLSRNTSATAPALILTLGLITTSAVAGTSLHEGRHRNTPRAHAHAMLQPLHQNTRRDVARRAGHAAPVPSATYLGPGYVFVPGRGILGEDCNMPTSTCPNELRDAQ